MPKLLDCACLFWRFVCDDMSLCARNHSTARMKKRQKGQPHATTLARGLHSHQNGEAFAPCGIGGYVADHRFQRLPAKRPTTPIANNPNDPGSGTAPPVPSAWNESAAPGKAGPKMGGFMTVFVLAPLKGIMVPGWPVNVKGSP